MSHAANKNWVSPLLHTPAHSFLIIDYVLNTFPRKKKKKIHEHTCAYALNPAEIAQFRDIILTDRNAIHIYKC